MSKHQHCEAGWEKEWAEMEARRAAKEEGRVRAHPLFVQMLEALESLVDQLAKDSVTELSFPQVADAKAAIAAAKGE